MAASPKYKVYSTAGEYIAAFKYAADALVFVDAIGEPGCTIRLGHHKRLTLWTEGQESDNFANSHAEAVSLVLFREDKLTAYTTTMPGAYGK